MPLLKFEVEADYDKVIKLREEITRLNDMLLKLPADAPVATVRNIEAELAKARGEFRSLTDAAAIAGAELEDGFKKKIYDASQTVNDFTEKVIGQKEKVRTMSTELRRLSDELKGIAKDATDNDWFEKQHLIKRYNELKESLEQEKDALFNLTQEQATARLSVKRLRDEYALLKQEAGDGSEMFEQMKEQLVGMGKDLLKNIGIGVGIKEFIGQMVQVRGEFQEIETSLEVLLGSEEKAAKLMGEVKEFAKVSPLDLKSTAAATQMMLGFNIEAEKVPRYLQAIGDISMGNTQRFNSLTLAFSQMSATGKLMGQDLNQMINAGFNPLQIMADKTGKSIATLKEEMSKGAITSQMVQQAFIDATDAGGKFYQMSEKASKTINGQISMLQDALDAMFNSLGEQSEGVMLGAIETTTSLVENYETVGKVIAGLVAVYGAYKAALITDIALGQIQNKTLWANITATKAYTVAQATANKVLMASPYGLLAAAVTALGIALWNASTKTTELEDAQRSLNDAFSEAQKKTFAEQAELATLKGQLEALEVGSQEYLNVKNRIIDGFGKYYDGLQSEIEKVGLTEEAYNKLTEAINRSMMARQYETFAGEQQKKLAEQMGTSLEAVQKKIYDYYGSEKGAYIFTKIRDGLMKGDISKFGAGTTAIDTYGEEIGSIFNEELGSRAGRRFVRGINGAVFDYLRDKNAFDEVDKMAKERFGVVGFLSSSVESKDNTEDSQTKDRKYWEKQVSTRKEAYEQTVKGTKEAQTALTALKEAENELSKYSSYSGKSSASSQSTTDKRLQAEQKASDELLALKRQTQQSEIDILKDGTDKKIAQINLDYQKQMDAIAKQERTLREQNKVQKIDGLTDEQQTALDAQRKAAETTRDKQIADTYKADLAYMRDYLKEYGSFQQQKLAIAEEYNRRIAESTNDWEKRSLAKERDAAMSKLDFDSLKMQIDWTSVFGDFGTMFKDVTASVLPDLKKYVGSDEFKKLDAADQQVLVEAMQRLEKSLNGSKGLDFRKLGNDVKVYQEAVKRAQEAQIKEKEALDKLKKAQEEYQKALKSGTEEQKDAASIELSERKQEADEASKASKETSDAVKKAGKSVSDTAGELSASMDDVITGLQQLSSGSLAGAYEGIITFGKRCKGIIHDVAESLEKVPIVGWILSIIDVLQDGLSNLLGGLLDSIFNAIGGIIHDVLSLNLLKTVATSFLDGFKNIWDGLTFGGVSSVIDRINGSNAKEVTDTINRLTDRNERLITAISGLTETMKTQGIAQAVSTYNQAYANQQEVNQNLLDIARAQAGYHGSHHSWGSQWGGFSNSQMDYIRTNVRRDFNGDIFSLSPEEMAKLLDNVSIVESILNTGEGGYGSRLLERLEDYAAQAGKLEEITGELKENLTSVTFDSLRDSFHSSLMDMDKDAKDFSKDLSRYLMESVLNAKLKESLDKELEEWYDKWAEYSKSDGLDSRELEELQRRYNEIVEKGIAIRDEAAAITGYDSASPYTQEPSKGVYEGLSQDLGMEMNGRMTAIQDGVGRIEQLEAERNEMLRGMSALDGMSIADINSDNLHLLVAQQTEAYAVHDDVRRILAESYVELSAIRENTGAIVKPIKEIRSELGSLREEIRQNL